MVAPNPTPERPQIVDALAIGWHGALGRIASHRMVSAGNTMERMDHKEALYHDIGSMALNPDLLPVDMQEVEARHAATHPEPINEHNRNHPGDQVSNYDYLGPNEFLAAETATGKKATPRTVFERRTDSQLDRASYRKLYKAAQQDRINSIYGHRRAKTWGLKVGLATMRENRQVNAARRNGTITPSQARHYKHRRATPVHRVLNPEQFKAQWTHNVADRELDERVASTQLLSGWRNRRQRRAINRIQASHSAMQRHAERIAEIRNH